MQSSLLEARLQAIEQYHQRAIASDVAVTAPANVLAAEGIPVAEGGGYDIFIDGCLVVPTAEKAFHKTQWTTPSGSMRSLPSFRLEWDATKMGALTMCNVMVRVLL